MKLVRPKAAGNRIFPLVLKLLSTLLGSAVCILLRLWVIAAAQPQMPVVAPLRFYYDFYRIKAFENIRIDDERISREQEEVQKFVRAELESHAFPDANQLVVAYNPFTYYIAVYHNSILLDSSARLDFIKANVIHSPLFTGESFDGSIVEKYHSNSPEESQKMRDELRAVIHHEAGHLKNKDFSCCSLLDVLLPISNYIASQKLISHLNLRIPNRYMQSLMIAGSAYPLFLINQIITRMYSRYTERRADENIPNDPEILKGGISFFSKLAEQKKLAVANGEIIDSQNNLSSYLFRTHPTHEQRIARFQERLNALEKESKIKQVV